MFVFSLLFFHKMWTDLRLFHFKCTNLRGLINQSARGKRRRKKKETELQKESSVSIKCKNINIKIKMLYKM